MKESTKKLLIIISLMMFCYWLGVISGRVYQKNTTRKQELQCTELELEKLKFEI